MEIYKTQIDYNDFNNAKLSNENIQEVIYKGIKDQLDANNVTADIFSHMPNIQRESKNTICTSEMLDKSEELADTIKDLTINDVEYYVSKSATANDGK